MFGLFKKRHTLAVSVEDAAGHKTFIRIATHDGAMVERIAFATIPELPKSVKIVESEEAKSESTCADPMMNFQEEASDKETADMEAREKRLAEKQRKEVDAAKATIGNPRVALVSSKVKQPGEPLQVLYRVTEKQPESLPTSEVKERPRQLPLISHSQPESGATLAERVPIEKLAAMEAMKEAAAATAPPANMPPVFKIDDFGKVSFRIKYHCPTCGHRGLRWRDISSTFIKCHNCEERLLMEPATSGRTYNGHLQHDVPAPDAEGFTFHATRKH